jgi:subtilisin-like proprotein convertase family protein
VQLPTLTDFKFFSKKWRNFLSIVGELDYTLHRVESGRATRAGLLRHDRKQKTGAFPRNHSHLGGSLMKRYLQITMALTAVLAVCSQANAQVFSGTGPGGPIPDGTGSNTSGAPLISVASVAGSGPISAVTVDFVGLAHTFIGDVTLRLTHPNGTTFHDLQVRPGVGTGATFGFGGNFLAANTYSFSDTGTDLYSTPQNLDIPSGTFRTSSNPNDPGAPPTTAWAYLATSLNSTFSGLDAGGNWTLEARDFAGADTGSFTSWTVNVTVVPEPTSLALCGIAVGGLAWRRLRRKA